MTALTCCDFGLVNTFVTFSPVANIICVFGYLLIYFNKTNGNFQGLITPFWSIFIHPHYLSSWNLINNFQINENQQCWNNWHVIISLLFCCDDLLCNRSRNWEHQILIERLYRRYRCPWSLSGETTGQSVNSLFYCEI